jgi:histidinol-phosphate aminotransferase
VMIRGAYGKFTGWSRVSTGRIEDVRRYAAALPELVRA